MRRLRRLRLVVAGILAVLLPLSVLFAWLATREVAGRRSAEADGMLREATMERPGAPARGERPAERPSGPADSGEGRSAPAAPHGHSPPPAHEHRARAPHVKRK